MPDTSKNSVDATELELMARHGITRVPTEHFCYKSYRYTNFADALAQAKRDNWAPRR